MVNRRRHVGTATVAPPKRKASGSFRENPTLYRPTRSLALEHGLSGVFLGTSELVGNPQELVVLRDAVAAREAAGLDLSRVRGHGEISNECVLGLARSVRDDGSVTRTLSETDGIERLGERANLVDLDQNRVGNSLLDPLSEANLVRHEQVVADQLALLAKLLREQLPAVPVVFGQTVFDRDDRVLRAELLVDANHLFARALLLIERVLAVGVEFA